MEQQHFVDVFWKNREGRGHEFLQGGRGDWGAPICTSGSANDGELKRIREEVSSWLYVSSVVVCMYMSGGGDEAVETGVACT